MNASKVHIGVGAMVVVLLGALIAAPAGSAVPHQSTPKPAALCKFVASARDADNQAAVNFQAAKAKSSLGALRKADKLSLPAALDGAIKQLIPLYELLANGGNSAAFDQLDSYATKHCNYTNVGDIDACGLVSLEEAQALAGTPLDSPSKTDEACIYPGFPGGPTATVEIYIGPSAHSILGVDNRDGQLPPVPNLGDEAYLKSTGDIIYFQQSGVWVVIRVLRLDDVDRSQALQGLARAVVARL
jgi:hypothetical protein